MKNLWKIAALAGAMTTISFAQAETYAILVGINDYPDVVGKDGKPLTDEQGNPINTDLSGCVNDINTYQDVLVNNFGVDPDNIKKILDKQADEKGFLESWKWALQQIEAGDQIIFCYSGHGGQVKDDEEDDGLEEVIVLADNQLVSGNFFNELAREIQKGDISTTFVFDSCFSGGMSRDVFSFDGKPGTAKVKFLDTKVTERMTKVSDANLSGIKAMPKKAAAVVGAEYAFLFAGAEDQPTTDLDFKDPATPDRGLFSLLFGAVLEDDPSVSLTDAVEAIKTVLKEKGFKQVPGFEFSSPDRGKKPLLPKI